MNKFELAKAELRRLCNETCSYCDSDRPFRVGDRYGANGCHIFTERGDRYDGTLLPCKANITRRLLMKLDMNKGALLDERQPEDRIVPQEN